MILRIQEYDPLTADVAPEKARDLLKQLYHFLLPREIRHDLGEYYTPDWLAEHVLNTAAYNGDPDARLLDPACGSGTFLVAALARIRVNCSQQGLGERETLAACLANVVGIDLNPLAVMASRVNYLIALGSLIEYAPDEIDIPVYLADSILTPLREVELFARYSYTLSTVVGNLSFPATYGDARQIDVITKYLDEMVHDQASVSAFVQRVLSSREMPQPALNADEQTTTDTILTDLFNTLADRHSKGLDGIWARIIKNAFMPLYVGQFDFVVGNPPWVFWNSFPTKYRERLRSAMESYGLIASRMSTMKRLGSAGKDLSVLFVYVAADKYLREHATMAIVITQTVFQSTAGDEFRRFALPGGRHFAPIHVDDLVTVSPFSTATNKTACVVFRTTEEPKYPVRYTMWAATEPFNKDHADLSTVLSKTSRTERFAAPYDGGSGYWRILTSPKDVVESHEATVTARLGVETKLESAFRVRLQRRLPGRGTFVVTSDNRRAKVRIPEIHGQIDEELLYPYITGESVHAFGASLAGVYIVPHTAESGISAIPLQEMKRTFPNTLRYFSQVKNALEERTLHKRWGRDRTPFYSMYDIGRYTFAATKLVWKRTTRNFEAAVVTSMEIAPGLEKVVIPNGKVMMVPFNDQRVAHYVCAIVNSAPALRIINPSISSEAHRDILRPLDIPTFDSTNELHKELVRLSIAAHASAFGSEEQLVLRREIDVIVNELWGVSR
jgi:hypothetical protein